MNDQRTLPPQSGGDTHAPQSEESWASRKPKEVTGTEMWAQLQNRKKRSVTLIRIIVFLALLAALAVLIIGLVIVLM